MWLPTRPMAERAFQSALSALSAVLSNTGLPVSLLRVANSSRKVPTPAVHVTLVSPRGTPLTRFTVPYGMPVLVANAGRSLLATSSARRSRGPEQGQPGSSSAPACRESRCADSRPPTTLMLVSKTDTLMLMLKSIFRAIMAATLRNSE
uniref:Putative secreted protein n=1 Tax=Ixodes ricinus TaxID=34613 RepID=A0A6B0UVP4_IXORI